jgi:hypothetical protein
MYWLNEETLAPLFEVNERVLELISNRDHPLPSPPPSDPSVRKRVARCPILLVDAGLEEPGERRAGAPAVEEFFSREEAVPLAQMTFVLAWSMTRANRDAACIVLGISLTSAASIAGLGLRDLQRLAEDRWRLLRPRWVDRPEVWRRLAMPDGWPGCSPLGAVGPRALQLFFWELVEVVGC